MAEKFSVLIKYKYLEYVENAKLSDADSWILMKGIIEYDRDGKIPVFENPVSTALFAIIKTDLDANREKWEEKADTSRSNGKKGGRPRKTQITQDNPEKPKKPSRFSETQKNPNNPEKHDLDLDLDLDSEFEREEEVSPSPFPASDGLHPTRVNAISRVEQHRQTWQALKLPPAQIITNMSVLDSIKDTLTSFTDALIDEAIHNYAELLAQPWFDESVLPGGKRPAGFKNFMQRWIGYFISDNRPFETYRPRPHSTSPPKKGPDWGGAVDMGKPVKAKSFFEGEDK